MSAQRGSLEGTVRKTRPNELIPEIVKPEAIYPSPEAARPSPTRNGSSWTQINVPFRSDRECQGSGPGRHTLPTDTRSGRRINSGFHGSINSTPRRSSRPIDRRAEQGGQPWTSPRPMSIRWILFPSTSG